MKKVAVVSAILEQPTINQHEFNRVVSDCKGIVRGRLGVPFEEENIGVISLTILAEEEEIRRLSDRLSSLPDVSINTVLSRKCVN